MAPVLIRSPSWPQDRFSTVTSAWEGETCCVIGGGPSLKQSDVDLTRGLRVVAVNDAYRMAPWAEVCYFADRRWWTWHRDRPEFKSFAGQKCTIENGTGGIGIVAVEDPEVHVLRNYGTQGLSSKPDGLMTGQNSGYQGINLAVLAGCKRILLLGFDMHDGRHWHEQRKVPTDDSEARAWLANFVFIETPLNELGVEVVNCSPGSALTRFPMMPIEEACALTV